MTAYAIKVENLSKRYRVGLKENSHDTLTGAAISWLRSPLENFRQLRKLTHFADGEGESQGVIWALRDLSFDIKHGEVVGVIGRNGAGKSTLLKILSQITEPSAGRVTLRGRVSSLLEVGTGFHPELTGRENVYLNGTILGMTKLEIDGKFDEIVSFSGVEKFLDTPVKRYSSGMQVRLAFSVAAHLEPEILLVDEVLAVGDAGFQSKCIGKMGDVAAEGRTVLFVSHNMSAVSTLCQRTLVLRDGDVVADGLTENSVKQYLGFNKGESAGAWIRGTLPAADKEEISLLAVRLLDAQEECRASFMSNEEILVQIHVSIQKQIKDLMIGFELESAIGQVILGSFHSDVLSKGEFIPGEYSFYARIPKNLLNSHTYYISPCAGIYRKRLLFRHRQAVKFSVTHHIPDSGYTVAERPGDVAPTLHWRITEATQNSGL